MVPSVRADEEISWRTGSLRSSKMAPKRGAGGAKKLKAAGLAATASKKSPTKLREKVAAAKAAEPEEEEEYEEPDMDHLLSFFKKEEPAPAPAPAPAVASAPSPAPIPEADGTDGSNDVQISHLPAAIRETASESPSVAAAGSALNAKRALDSTSTSSAAAQSSGSAASAEGSDALAEALGMARKAAAPPVEPPVDDAALLEALKVARKAVADQQKIAFTMVCATDLLARVAEFKPTTLKQLADVDDFGPTRAERYGEPLLECVRSHLAKLKAAGGGESGEQDAGGSSGGSGGSSGSGDKARAASESAAAAGSSTRRPGEGRDMGGDHIGLATIRYNHYVDSFPLLAGGKLDFRLVDEKYALSYVFKGSPSFRLRPVGGAGGGARAGCAGGDERRGAGGSDGEAISPNEIDIRPDGGERSAGCSFSGLVAGREYLVMVDEDPKEKARAAANGGSKAYSAAVGSKGGGGGFGRAVGGGTRGSALVTAELKKMSAEELREAGPKYRALLEARDLEDALGGGGENEVDTAILGEDSSGCSCLYGNPCAMPHACKDWRNRFEVAKKNGWKGF